MSITQAANSARPNPRSVDPRTLRLVFVSLASYVVALFLPAMIESINFQPSVTLTGWQTLADRSHSPIGLTVLYVLILAMTFMPTALATKVLRFGVPAAILLQFSLIPFAWFRPHVHTSLNGLGYGAAVFAFAFFTAMAALFVSICGRPR